MAVVVQRGLRDSLRLFKAGACRKSPCRLHFPSKSRQASAQVRCARCSPCGRQAAPDRWRRRHRQSLQTASRQRTTRGFHRWLPNDRALGAAPYAGEAAWLSSSVVIRLCSLFGAVANTSVVSSNSSPEMAATWTGGGLGCESPTVNSIWHSRSRTSAALWGRCSGSFSSSSATSSSSGWGGSGRKVCSRGAGSNRILVNRPVMCCAANGCWPVKSSNATQPSANRSAEPVMSRRPRACSGAMYSGRTDDNPVRVSQGQLDSAAGHPKVEHRRFFGPTVTQKQVGGLYVTMDDAVLVGDGQHFGDAAQKGFRLRQSKAVFAKPPCQVLPFQPFHRQNAWVSAWPYCDVPGRCRGGEARQEPDFAFKPRHSSGWLTSRLSNLTATQLFGRQVAGFPHRTHSTFSDLRQKLKAARERFGEELGHAAWLAIDRAIIRRLGAKNLLGRDGR